MSFVCERCGHQQAYCTWVTNRWRDENCMQRCERCGVPHSCAYGREASAISPPLAGIATPGGKRSPWFDARYRPYVTGVFECEWPDGLRLRLMWDGRAWTWTGLVVDTTRMLKWRGTWVVG